ncbi:MAG TPA: cytochrome c [Caulobacteraceae bacterium]
MTPATFKTIALGALAALVVAGGYAVVQARSQAVLQARHPLRPTAVRAATTPGAIAEGGHLVQVAGCGICHGRELAGKMLAAAGSPLAAPNLTRIDPRRTDAELDRAIRSGVRPNGTSELAMPSHVYAGFTDAETAAIVGYLRSLKPLGAVTVRPAPGFMQRVDLAVGFMHPEALRIAGARPPIDLGPRFQAGRHLAALACGQCHGTDLAGGHGAPGPDMMVRGGYSRAQFHALMRTGDTPSGRELGLMSETARANFSHFTDAEIDAIYDYLDARDVRLDGPKPRGG